MAVFLSAARIPASRGERKSKDPEDVYPAIQLQGVLLKHFSEPCLPAAIENSAIRIQLEFPDATLTKDASSDVSTRSRSPALTQRAKMRAGRFNHCPDAFKFRAVLRLRRYCLTQLITIV